MIELLNTLLLLFAVIDPIGSVPVYLEATKHFDKAHRKKIAIRASFTAYFVLIFFIVVGQIILEGMEISLAAFQISGGIILFLFALTMIFGESKPESEKLLIKDYKKVTVFPVAMPSIASPGAIMAVVLLTDNHEIDVVQQIFISILLAIIIALTCTLLLASNAIMKKLGESGSIVISKVMGLILSAYAAQSVLNGIQVFFAD